MQVENDSNDTKRVSSASEITLRLAQGAKWKTQTILLTREHMKIIWMKQHSQNKVKSKIYCNGKTSTKYVWEMACVLYCEIAREDL